MARYHHNKGLRKRCPCGRRAWSGCPHPWYLNFQWKGELHRISLNQEADQPILSKAEADTAADRIKIAIRAGTFVRKKDHVTRPPVIQKSDLTLAAFGDKFVDQYKTGLKYKKSWKNDVGMLRQLEAVTLPDGTKLTEKPIGLITETDWKHAFVWLRSLSRSASTQNKYLQFIHGLQKFGVKEKYLSARWLDQEADLKRQKHAQRNRRVSVEEEQALVAAASPRLQRVIIAALETGCREGELLDLQWGNVDLARRRITIPRSKTGEGRVLPIRSGRLRAVLEMVRHDPDGKELPATAFVFGDEIGGKVQSIRTPWEKAVLTAHGVKPTRTKTHSLTADCRTAFKTINLHFHDLRHEAGSRWHEAGVPLSHVSYLLGHRNLATTSIYINAVLTQVEDSLDQFEQEKLHKIAQEAENRPLASVQFDDAAISQAIVH